jgi:hypothetical protein
MTTWNKWPISPGGGHEHTFADIVPCDDLHFNDTLTQYLDNQYPRARHAFPRQWYMCKRGGGYLFLPGFPSLYDAIHGWMIGQMDRQMGHVKKLHEKQPRCPLFYSIMYNLLSLIIQIIIFLLNMFDLWYFYKYNIWWLFNYILYI